MQRWFSLFGVQPHRQRHFKLSNDPFFVEKVRDIVGLYLLTADNYANHKHPRSKPGSQSAHGATSTTPPTYVSWLNRAERWFGIITQTAIRRGSFSSFTELVNKTERFVHHYNQKAKPFM